MVSVGLSVDSENASIRKQYMQLREFTTIYTYEIYFGANKILLIPIQSYKPLYYNIWLATFALFFYNDDVKRLARG